MSSPVAAAARPTGARASFVAPFTEDEKSVGLFELPEWVPPASWMMPAGASEPQHFKDLFKAVVAGPAVWTARQAHEWARCFRYHLREGVPSYDTRRRTVEAARRAFSYVASTRDEFFGKRGVTYSLASTAMRGW